MLNRYVFCCSYILNVPFDKNDEAGIVYVWIGSKSDPAEARLAEEIAESLFNNPWISLQVILNLRFKAITRFIKNFKIV